MVMLMLKFLFPGQENKKSSSEPKSSPEPSEATASNNSTANTKTDTVASLPPNPARITNSDASSSNVASRNNAVRSFSDRIEAMLYQVILHF